MRDLLAWGFPWMNGFKAEFRVLLLLSALGATLTCVCLIFVIIRQQRLIAAMA